MYPPRRAELEWFQFLFLYSALPANMFFLMHDAVNSSEQCDELIQEGTD